MSEIVTLELPPHIAESAKAVALRTHRRLEDVLVEWMDQAAAELPDDSLPDDQVLALCDMQMSPAQNDELSELLGEQQGGALDDAQRAP